MCATERNRNGIVGTCVSGQIAFIGLMLTRVMSSAPILTWSMVSFSLPSAPLVEDLDLVLAAAALLEQFAHVLDGDHGRVVVGVVDVGRTEFGGLGGERHAREQCGNGHRTGVGDAEAFMECLLWWDGGLSREAVSELCSRQRDGYSNGPVRTNAPPW